MGTIFRWTFLALVLISSLSHTASATGPRALPFNYIIYIAGDYSPEGELRGEDSEIFKKSWALYKHFSHLAQTDKLNNYALFFDPKGSTWLREKYKVKKDFYIAGKKNLSQRLLEIDQTDYRLISDFIIDSAYNLESPFYNPTLFFYFGPRLSKSVQFNKDDSELKSSLTYEQLSFALSSYPKEVDLLYLHTNYNNTLEATSQFHQAMVQQIILRTTPLNWQRPEHWQFDFFAKANSVQELSQNFTQATEGIFALKLDGNYLSFQEHFEQFKNGVDYRSLERHVSRYIVKTREQRQIPFDQQSYQPPFFSSPTIFIESGWQVSLQDVLQEGPLFSWPEDIKIFDPVVLSSLEKLKYYPLIQKNISIQLPYY